MNMPPQSRFDGEKAREFWEKEASRFEDHWPLIANLLRDRGHNAWLAHECDRLTAENKALIAAASEKPAQLAPPTEAEIAWYRDIFRAELDKRMDPKHPSASPSTEAHAVALSNFVEKRNAANR